MLFTIRWLSGVFSEYRGNVNQTKELSEVLTDSRKTAENTLFVPIIGENFDGHDYAIQAIRNGAAAMLWDRQKALPDGLAEDFPVFLVEDTVKGLQLLAAAYRNLVDPIVIGITGSNGKTTTKDLVAAVLKTTYKTHYTDGNFNNHIGMPLTILSMPTDTEALVLEMGMSDFGEIDLLSRLARPDYAIITNIGESHIEFLGSREGIAKAKLEIVNGLKDGGTLIIDGDEALLQDRPAHIETIKCGMTANNDLQISNVVIRPPFTSFDLSDGNNYEVQLLGEHHAKNAAYSLALGNKLNIPIEDCRKALGNLEMTAMRFQLLEGRGGASVINDAYNASPTSMKAAIEVVKQMPGYSNKVLVLGDVLELGGHAELMHRSIAEVIEHPITAVFTLGAHSKVIAETLQEGEKAINSRHFQSKEALVDSLDPFLSKGTLLLFKASRGLKFETMVESILK